jgi:uncharacterized membrane protein (UPF0182 family)
MNESIYLRQRQPPRRRVLLLIVAVLAVIFFSSRTVLGCYVDSLWFGSLGYAEVFRKTISLQWLVFAGFFASTFFGSAQEFVETRISGCFCSRGPFY